MSKQLEIKYIPISELKKLPKNPKLHDIGELHNSFNEFGFRDAIKVNRLTNHIEAGNGRLETLLQKKQKGESSPSFIIQENGEWLAPVLFFEDDEKTERRFALADNRIGELGGFDEPLLLENLIDLKEDLFATGYTSEDIDLLNEKLDGDYKHSEKDDQVPEVQKIAITKPGELWLLGRHRLLCGDATKKENVEKLMDGKKADMVFTDPPYGVNYKYESYKDDPRSYERLADGFWNVKPVAQLTMITVGHKWNNFWFKKEPQGFLVWFDNTKQSPSNIAYLCKSELILIFGKVYERFAWDTLEINQPRNDGLRELHSCPKPFELWHKIIDVQKQATNIYDCFLGSGTTLIACEKTNRICYGMEIEPLYIDVIIRRWQDFTGLEATREDGVKFNELI